MNMSSSGFTSTSSRARLIDNLTKVKGVRHEVLDAMEFLPRHEFVDPGFASRAYDDTVLPIGFNQTISQPRVVAMMSSALIEVGQRNRVLEIGTGCGYQTAILAMLFDHVFTVERIRPLHVSAKQRLEALRIRNVIYRLADGHIGWEEEAPYDAVICTAAFKEIPNSLLSQLSEQGRLVVPVNHPGENFQDLKILDRTESGWKETVLAAVTFVPMLTGTQS